jgi:hypothetical protein
MTATVEAVGLSPVRVSVTTRVVLEVTLKTSGWPSESSETACAIAPAARIVGTMTWKRMLRSLCNSV